MITNLHTHTPRCRHAVGSEEAYVQAGIQAGLQTLGFSDHTPYWFDGNHYSSFRMFPEQFPDYVDSVLDLQKQYAGQLDIRLGLEAEFYPAFFPELLARLKDSPVEYLLLGQHYIGNEIGDHYSGWATADEELLRRYCHQVADAMYTGLFTYLAHPDLIHYVGDRNIHREHMKIICQAARDCALPLEINLLGIREGRHYPNRVFWELAAQENCQVVLGIDAHDPQALLDQQREQLARQLAAEFGLELLEEPVIRKL